MGALQYDAGICNLYTFACISALTLADIWRHYIDCVHYLTLISASTHFMLNSKLFLFLLFSLFCGSIWKSPGKKCLSNQKIKIRQGMETLKISTWSWKLLKAERFSRKNSKKFCTLNFYFEFLKIILHFLAFISNWALFVVCNRSWIFKPLHSIIFSKEEKNCNFIFRYLIKVHINDASLWKMNNNRKELF